MAIAYAKLYELILKNELKDELRGELATKEDVILLKNEIDIVRKELRTEIELIRRDMIIIALIIILAMYAPGIIEKLLLFK